MSIHGVFGIAALFIIIAAPSLKIFLPLGELLNILPVGLIAIGLLLEPNSIKLNKYDINILVPYWLFFAVLLSSFFINPIYLSDLKMAAKYIVLIIITLSLPFLIKEELVDKSIELLFIWGIFIAIIQISVGVKLGENQHYLTVGLPIGVAALIAIAKTVTEIGTLKKVHYLAVFVICMVSSMTMFGRAPIIFPLLIIFMFALTRIIFGTNVRHRYYYLSLFAACLISLVLFYETIIPAHLQDRLERMIFMIHEEPRVQEVYLPAIEAIKESPFGYGLEASWSVVGFYPHNIFLEIMISSGIVGLIPFMAIILLFFKASFFFFKQGAASRNWLALTFVAMFHFFFWNVSHDLSSAYGLLPLMLIVTLGYLKESRSSHDHSSHSYP